MSAATLENTMTKSRETSIERAQASSELVLAIDLRWVIRIFATIITALLVTGTAANIISNQVAPSKDHKLVKLMNRFDLGFEPSLPNWYSSIALLSCGLLLGAIAYATWRAKDHWRWHWVVLSGLFIFLSIDEGVRFHEMLHTVMVELVEPAGLLYFPWVIPALIFVSLVGLSYLPFLWHLPRRIAFLFVGAGGMFVAGAVGMDMVGGVLVENYGMESVQHSVAQFFEECGEMFGVLLFAVALLEWMRIHFQAVSVRIT